MYINKDCLQNIYTKIDNFIARRKFREAFKGTIDFPLNAIDQSYENMINLKIPKMKYRDGILSVKLPITETKNYKLYKMYNEVYEVSVYDRKCMISWQDLYNFEENDYIPLEILEKRPAEIKEVYYIQNGTVLSICRYNCVFMTHKDGYRWKIMTTLS